MLFTFGRYTVDVDVDKTRELYEKLPFISQSCGCDNCINFEKAADFFSGDVTAFFNTLGVNPKKTAECMKYTDNPDGTSLYGGFYHLCGRLVEGDDAWVEISKSHSVFERDLAYKVNEHFFASFRETASSLSEEFNCPLLQLEFEADVPQLPEKTVSEEAPCVTQYNKNAGLFSLRSK